MASLKAAGYPCPSPAELTERQNRALRPGPDVTQINYSRQAREWWVGPNEMSPVTEVN